MSYVYISQRDLPGLTSDLELKNNCIVGYNTAVSKSVHHRMYAELYYAGKTSDNQEKTG